MKQKEFNEMPFNTMVRIKGRLAKMVSLPMVSPLRIKTGSSWSYSWAIFEYLDTHRKVTKRHRQVERVF